MKPSVVTAAPDAVAVYVRPPVVKIRLAICRFLSFQNGERHRSPVEYPLAASDHVDQFLTGPVDVSWVLRRYHARITNVGVAFCATASHIRALFLDEHGRAMAACKSVSFKHLAFRNQRGVVTHLERDICGNAGALSVIDMQIARLFRHRWKIKAAGIVVLWFKNCFCHYHLLPSGPICV